jgi:hypothetical protein
MDIHQTNAGVLSGCSQASLTFVKNILVTVIHELWAQMNLYLYCPHVLPTQLKLGTYLHKMPLNHHESSENMTYLCTGGRKILHIFSTYFIQSREKVQYKRCPQKFNVWWSVAWISLQTAILYLGVCMISACTSRIYCLICMKFRVWALHIMLLGICEFYGSQKREGHTFWWV